MLLTDREAEVRGELGMTLGTMKKEYGTLVASFWDKEVVQGFRESAPVMEGKILGALQALSVYQQGWWRQDTDIRGKDTYHWCLALHDCTKYLACDDRYKEKGRASIDDRFKRVYQNNYYFRRRWVAFLRQIMEYVVMINTGEDVKPYANAAELQAAYAYARNLDGYSWEAIKRDLDTAQQKIDAEPVSARRWANLKGQRAHVQDLLDDRHGADVSGRAEIVQMRALLGRMQGLLTEGEMGRASAPRAQEGLVDGAYNAWGGCRVC